MRTAAPTTPAPRPPGEEPRRIIALDAVRGLALTILLFVNTAGVRSSLPAQLDHPEWHGFTFADTFFPVFLFAMGGAMAFSRTAARFGTTIRRVVLLFAFGVGLAVVRHGEPSLPGILQKIAIAYLLAWIVMRVVPERWHLAAAFGIVGAMWAAFLWAAVPGVVPGSWEQGTNFAAFIDRAVLGRPATEGFATAIMASANVIAGAVVLRDVRYRGPAAALSRIVAWTVAALALGLAVALLVPVNKRMWTPSFTILTHGTSCLYLAVYWWIAEIRDRPGLVRPFTVLGRNPILIYVGFTVLHELLVGVRTPLMDALAGPLPPLGASLVWSVMLLGVAVALADQLDRRRIYLRV